MDGVAGPPKSLRLPEGRELRLTREGELLEAWPGHTLPVTLAQLRERYRVDSPVWHWLRTHGFRRPSPAGPRLSDEEREARGERRLSLRLPQDVVQALEELTREGGYASRSEALADAIRARLAGLRLEK